MTGKILITLLLITAASRISAQKFSQDLDLALPDSIVHADAAWHDLDNDGLLDIVLMTKTNSGAFLIIVRGNAMDMPAIYTIMAIDSFTTFSFADFNRDNQLDLLISPADGSSSVVFKNMGELSFSREETPLPPFRYLKVGDVDNDGYMDVVMATDIEVLIFPGGISDVNSASDTFDIAAVDLEIFDADNNGTADIFVSGQVDNDSSFTGIIPNRSLPDGKVVLWTEIPGNGTVGHLDDDGFQDVLFTADSLGHPVIKTLSLNRGPITINNIPTMFPQQSFTGDFNLDGRTDIALLGKNPAGDTINVIQHATDAFFSLPAHNLLNQVIADPEDDGDLDVLQVVRQDSLHVLVLRNIDSTLNEGPASPEKTVAIDIFGKLLIYWTESTDDHTLAELLTYDLWLSNVSGVTLPSAFNLSNNRRMSAIHGNGGSQNFKFFHDYDHNGLGYTIQSVDNAFHATTNTCSGVPVLTCLNVEEELHVVDACRRKSITLTGPGNVLWFSMKDGFRSTGAQLTVFPNHSDTLFYFNPADESCFGLKVFFILIKDDTLTTNHASRYTCEGAIIEFDSSPLGNSVTWESFLHGNLGEEKPLRYIASTTDTVVATISKSQCTLIHMTPVQISKPQLRVDAERWRILKGASVQLTAHGATQYTWEPSDNLSDPAINNPIAMPSKTTRYTVIGYDSLHCQAKTVATIEVDETGFIPTLFTPNDDGQNDYLQIFGLSAVDNISFSIFNREGTQVFHTTSLAVAAEGWSGIYRGAKQPGGIYYWKISGSLATGGKLLLNGKESGSLVLVR